MNQAQLNAKRLKRTINRRAELKYKNSDEGRRAIQHQESKVREMVRQRVADEEMARFIQANGFGDMF